MIQEGADKFRRVVESITCDYFQDRIYSKRNQKKIVNGLLLDLMDHKDIASKIVELLSSRDKRESMGMREIFKNHCA